MMAASGQFAHPGGMPGHAMPHGAHPMGPGHPQGPGGAAVSMGQQMHMGNPQAGQGPMMGMPQGGGPVPNAHALSHLNPGANPQQLQLQQQMMQQNPHLLQAQQQHLQQQRQAAMIRQHQQQQQQAQQAQQQQQQPAQMMMTPNGPRMNMSMGANVPVSLPPHMQAQLQSQQQQQFLHQQQQHQAAQQQAAMHQQQMAMALQQQQQQQQAQQAQQQQHQQLQQQNANQQAGNQGQPTPGQQPMRPPSQMQNHPQQDQQAQQQAQMAQNQQQAQTQNQQQGQQTPQGPQNGPPGPAQAQTPGNMSQQGTPQQQHQQQQQQQAQQAQQQQQQQQQQHQAQQQGQQPQQGMPGQHALQKPQQGEMNPQQAQRMMQQQAQIQAAMRAQLANTVPGNSMLKLLNFADQLSQFSLRPGSGSVNDIRHWQQFVDRHFAPTGVLRQTIANTSDSSGKNFELINTALPRYYFTHFQHGVQQIQMILENAHEKDLPSGGHFVECSRASIIHWYAGDHQVVSTGQLRASFNVQGKLDLLELSVVEHNEYVLLSKLHIPSGSPEIKSPNISKKQKNQAKPKPPPEPSFTIPRTVINEWGVSPPMLMFFELAETFSHMQQVFEFYSKSGSLSPPEALRQLVTSWANNQQTATHQQSAMMAMQGMGSVDGLQQGAGNLNPAFANNHAAMVAHRQSMAQAVANAQYMQNMPQQNFSPAQGAHLALPGAANTSSPAGMGMQGPMGNGGIPQAAGVAMVAQASQQGSAGGSQGASANTSPHVSNKKRRASQVKMEGDVDGDGVNGVKVKQSPRVGGKRQKP